MKKLLIVSAFALLTVGAFAQDVQLHYDFGHSLYKSGDKDLSSRGHITTTVENFKADKWGSSYYFVDMDYKSTGAVKNSNCLGAYWEISREFCFWQDTKLNWLSVHVEYDGGLNNAVGSFNNSFLTGLTYSGHSADYSKTWSLSAMYKLIPGCKDAAGNDAKHNFQVTGVWGINFAGGWCTFSGFIDFWRENRAYQNTEYILLSEPQFWVNLNKIEALSDVNLSLGGEVEISNNFAGKGFYCIPTLAAKWTF